MDNAGSTGWWEWLAGIVFITVSALFGYTHKRIGDVESELKGDQVEEITNLRSEIERMERMFNLRFQEGKEDRNEMWRTIQANQASQEKQHAQNLEKLNQIPTRDEMMRLLQQFATHKPLRQQ